MVCKNFLKVGDFVGKADLSKGNESRGHTQTDIAYGALKKNSEPNRGTQSNIVLTCQVVLLTTALSFVAQAGWPAAIFTMARSVVFSRSDLF